VVYKVLSIWCLSLSLTQAAQAPRFVEETGQTSMAHVYTGDWEFFVGGGVAVLDCDSDGRPDLYLAGGAGKARLYQNRTRLGGSLQLAAVNDSGAEHESVTGAYPLDIDGDGHLDLALLRVGENLLLRGSGGCSFASANEDWGFAGGSAWTTAFSARWEPNMVSPTMAIGNYVDRAAPGAPWGTCHDNELHRPDDSGRARYRAPIPLTPGHCALSALFSDWNRSGRAALRFSNDRQYYRGGEEQLYRIDSGQAPIAYTRDAGWRRLTIWGMGIASADLSGDGYPEYFLTSMGDNKLRALAQGPGQPTYEDRALRLGLTAHRPFVGEDVLPSTAWHAEFGDVNNDGYLDLFIAKGNVEAMEDFAQRDPNNLLLGLPDGRFEEAADRAGILDFNRSRGGALVDLNQDGLLDLVVVNRGAPARIWRNLGDGGEQTTIPMGNWLQLQLLDNAANRNAVGAWIEVRIGNRTLRKEVTVGGGHAGGSAGWVHFGLGTAQRARVRVQWPDGQWSPWIRVFANQFARLRRDVTRAETWLPP